MPAARLLLLFILAVATFTGYVAYGFWKTKIDPRRSAAYFILFMLVNLATIFILVFIFSFVIFQYKEFFFKG